MTNFNKGLQKLSTISPCRPLGLFAFLPLIFLTGCSSCGPSDGGDDLIITGPELYASACAESTIEINDVQLGETSCQFDFADSDLSVRTSKQLFIGNGGSGQDDELIIVGMELLDGAEESFSLTETFSLENPLKIPPGAVIDVTLAFRPFVLEEQEGTLRIFANAINIPEENTTDLVYDENDEILYFDIPLTGTGSDNGLPIYAADREQCDFGRVAAGAVGDNGLPTGGVGNCIIRVFNESEETNPVRVKPLRIESIAFLEEDEAGNALPITPANSIFENVFKFDGAPPTESDAIYPQGFVPENGQPVRDELSLSFLFSPDDFGPFSTKVMLMTNDPNQREITIDLFGEGVEAPLCQIQVASIGDIDYEPREDGTLPRIEPLDDVTLTTEYSEVFGGGTGIIATEWRLISKPADSRVTFSDPFGVRTAFIANELPGIDVAGLYTIRARVQDDQGVWSVNPCEAVFEARPLDDFLTQLTWDSIHDQDLHVSILSDGGFCHSHNTSVLYPESYAQSDDIASSVCAQDEDGCFWGNCSTFNGNSPYNCNDWDGDGENGTSGDICLDRDIVDQGYGPENSNIDLVTPGQSFIIAVHGFDVEGGSNSTVKVFLFGNLVYEEVFNINSGDWVEYAIVHWDEDANVDPCIEVLSTPEDECPQYADRLN